LTFGPPRENFGAQPVSDPTPSNNEIKKIFIKKISFLDFAIGKICVEFKG